MITNFYKFLESVKVTDNTRKMNEGGGAGIDFKTTFTLDVELKVSNDTVEVVKYVIDGTSFDAKGYDDGMQNVKFDLLKSVQKVPTIEEIKQLRFLYDTDKYGIQVDSGIPEDQITEGPLTLGDVMAKMPVAVYNISSSIDIEYQNMLFGGWTRGNVEEGTTIFDGKTYELTHDDNMYCQVEGHDESYKAEMPEELTDKLMPSFVATDEFVNFYNAVFNIDAYDEIIQYFKSDADTDDEDGKALSLAKRFCEENDIEYTLDDIVSVVTSEDNADAFAQFLLNDEDYNYISNDSYWSMMRDMYGA
jgi:hypothetical protein